MKKFLIAAAGVVALTAPALAADLPARSYKAAPMVDPGYNWTGFYIGLNGGGGFGSTNADTFGMQGAVPLTPGSTGAYNLGHNWSGGLGGVQAGANWQAGSWVWGVEADIDGADIRGTGTVSGVGVTQVNGGGGTPANFTSAMQHIEVFGTVRGRAGFLAAPNLLLYGTGGLAYADVERNGHFSAPGIDYIGSSNSVQAGWTVGAGLEYKWTGNWSVKGEYLYYDLGNRSVVSTIISPFQTQYNFSTHGSIARVGINYGWGGPIVARY